MSNLRNNTLESISSWHGKHLFEWACFQSGLQTAFYCLSNGLRTLNG